MEFDLELFTRFDQKQRILFTDSSLICQRCFEFDELKFIFYIPE